jgi:putative ABC transport system permease protein
MLNDCLFAIRTLHKRPAYAISVVFTLAIGIGATTLMFSLVDASILRPLPFTRADRLVFLTGVFGPQRVSRGGSFPEVRDWRALNQTMQDVAMYDETSLNLQNGADVSRVAAEMVSAAYFPILGVRAELGRTFTEEEDAVPDKHAVAVISHALWQRLFGGDPGILQRTITLNDRTVSIIGVMPPPFAGLSFDTDIWVPSMLVSLTSSPGVVNDRGSRWLGAVGRLKDRVPLDTAQRDLDRVAALLEEQHPQSNRQRGVRVVTVRTGILGNTAGLLLALFGGVVLFLVVACANVASLQLARAVSRRRELAVRRALGATRFHVVRQLLAESLVLALLAGIVGILAAAWALAGVTSWLPEGTLARYAHAIIDPRAVAFALGASCLAAAAVSILPGLSAYRHDLSGVMKEGERAAGPGLASLRKPSVQHGLVIAEIALAMTLLTAAGLMVRSLERQGAVPLGFDQHGVTVAQLTLPAARYSVPERAVFVEKLVAGLERLPLVKSATVATSLPLTGNVSASTLFPDTASTADQGQRFYRIFVTPRFLETLGIPLVRGRTFAATDTADAPPVALINESAARRIWGSADPIGRQFRFGSLTGLTVQIVGVVGDARFRNLTSDLTGPRVEPDVFFPFGQRTDRDIEVAIRTVDGSIVPPGVMQQTVNGIAGGIPIFRVRPLSAAVAAQTTTARFGSLLFTVFSAGALLLAAVGLYGLITYVVGLGRREIAIRLALGADVRRVVGMVVANGMSLAAIGIALGGLGSFAAGRALRAQLFQTQPIDPLTLTGVAALLLFVSFLAAVLPSRRAARVEPHTALRGS